MVAESKASNPGTPLEQRFFAVKAASEEGASVGLIGRIQKATAYKIPETEDIQVGPVGAYDCRKPSQKYVDPPARKFVVGRPVAPGLLKNKLLIFLR